MSQQPQWMQDYPQWAIFDLDGTLCDITHRLHCVVHPDGKPGQMLSVPGNPNKDWKPDYDKFNSLCSADDIKWKIAGLLKVVQSMDINIAIFTGREEKWRNKTMNWLSSRNIRWDMLVMRPDKDYRSDDVIKREMFLQRFKPEEIWFVVDDREKVVKMWRDLGITTLQCQKGDY